MLDGSKAPRRAVLDVFARGERGVITVRSVGEILGALPAENATAVLDRCHDPHPQVVAAIAGQWPELRMLNATNVGCNGRRRIHGGCPEFRGTTAASR